MASWIFFWSDNISKSWLCSGFVSSSKFIRRYLHQEAIAHFQRFVARHNDKLGVAENSPQHCAWKTPPMARNVHVVLPCAINGRKVIQKYGVPVTTVFQQR
jgi:hypothetical protein